MELQTGGFAGDIARAQGQLQAFSGTAKIAGETANQFALDAQKGFNNVADGIAGLVKKTAILGLAGAAGLGAFVRTASGLETTSLQMQALIGNTEEANKVYGDLYNYVLGKPIAFPDASKAAATLLGYGRTAGQVQNDMKTLSTLSIVNGADLQALSLVFGQVTSRGALFGQDALQLINNRIPLTNILARKLGVSMEEAAGSINGGKISAQQFTEAMDEYAQSLDIGKFSGSFRNRMISMQGSIRAFGNEILGLSIDPIKGLVIESGGLFDRISQGLADLGPKLRSLAPIFKSVLTAIADNMGTVVAAVGALGAAFVAAKVGAFAAGLAAFIPQIGIFITSIKAGAGAMQALNVAMLANPAGLIVAAVVGLAAALTFLQIKFDIFGKAFRALQPTFDKVREAFKQLWDFLKPIRDFVGDQLKSAFESLVSIGKQLADSFKPVIDALKGILANKTVQTVLKGIGIALLAIAAAPVVAFFAGVIAVITVLSKVLGFIATHFDTIKKVVLVAIAVAFLPLTLAIGAVILIVKNFQTIISTLGGIFSAVGGAIAGTARAIGSVFMSVFNGIKSVVTTVFGAIVAVYNVTLKPVLSLIIYLVTSLGKIWWSIFSGIAQVTWIIVSTIVQIIGVVLYGIVSFIWNNILTPIGKFFKSVWDGIYATVSAVVNAVWGVIRTVFTAVWGTISSILSAIWGTITSVFNSVAGFISGVWNSIYGTVSGIFRSLWGAISGIASGIWGSISSTFNNIKNTVVNAVRDAYNGVIGFAKDFIQAGKNIIDGIVKGVAGGKDAVVNKVKDIAKGALDSVKNFFGIKSPSRVMAQMGNYLMEGFAGGVQQKAGAMARTMYNASDNIASSFNPTLSGQVDYSRIGVGSAAALAGNRSSVQMYGNINISSDADGDRFLTNAGLMREGQLVEKGMAV